MDLIKAFSELVYSKTIEIIRRKSGVENINNYLRTEKNQAVFLEELRNYFISEGHIVSEKYADFIRRFKNCSI